MNLSLYIAKRLSTKEGGNFSGLIIKMAIAAMAISMTVMILSTASVTGFQKGIKDKVMGFGGHLEVSRYESHFNYDYPTFPIDSALQSELKALPNVKNVFRIATKPGIIKASDDNNGIILKGVDYEYDWSYLKKHLVDGRCPQFKENERVNEVIISKNIADKLKLKVGDKLRVYFIQESVRAMAPQIVGIYNTGLEDFDKLFALGNISDIQRIFSKNKKELTHYEVVCEDVSLIANTKKAVSAIIPPELKSTDAKEQNPQIFDWLDLLDMNVYIVLILMLVVAAINIITALLILILERVNMVGVLKTLGERNWNIRNIFIYKLIRISVIGMIVGNLLGIGLGFLQQKTGFIKLSEETYHVSEVMIRIEPLHVLAINLGAFAVSFISILVASKLVTSIEPAKTVKFE
jgi:lipoprotein-releasing system permease protein